MWKKMKGWALAALAVTVGAFSGVPALAADTVIQPTEMGIDYSGTIAAVGVTFAAIVGAAIALMIGIRVVVAFVGWISRALS